MKRLLRTTCVAVLAIALAGCAARPAWFPLWSTPMPGHTIAPLPTLGVGASAPASGQADENKIFKTDVDTMDNPRVVVYKEKHTLEVWDGDTLMARMTVALGQDSDGPKRKQGDNKTPEGEYFICKTSNKGKFYKSLFLSYPNPEDAQAGLDDGTITQSQYDDIADAAVGRTQPPWNTGLGGEIAINGTGTGGEGKTGDWTAGSVAVSDEDMDYLWKYIKEGTDLAINP